MNLIKSIFCSHDWQKIDENKRQKSYTVDIHIYHYQVKTVLLSCKKCGKIEKKII